MSHRPEPPAATAADPFRFVRAVPLRWVDVDVAGIVNNAVYWSLIEQARFDYFDELGLIEGDVPSFVMGEATIRFERPGRRGMPLAVAVRTTRLGGRSFEMAYEVRNGAERLVSARALLVWTDAHLKSAPIPEAARAKLAAFEGIAARA